MPSAVMNETRKPSPPRPVSNGNGSHGTGASSALPAPDRPVLRGHLSARALAELKSPPLGPPPLPRRRSSILSFGSLDDTRHSARDFIRPGLGFEGEDSTHDDEPSHWHSSPLAFAFLPALAGLFFTNGSAFVTDALLLGLAALFLNWSVRLPWDWYHSAQAIAYLPSSRCSSVTLEEVEEVDEAEDANGHSTRKPGTGKTRNGHLSPSSVADSREHDEDAADAAFRLRRHELLALTSTFVVPVMAAYLLHVIRSQLSRPSEGLVSDYNLTIFLLAAEIRPIRQLIRITTNRTLHLQRIVNANRDSAGTGAKRDRAVEELAARLVSLESKSSGTFVSSTGPTPQEELAAMSADMKRRYEPRLDALERAVRRYEKRATTLTLLTEQRLQSLETRLQDALSLAAVAAQSNNKPGLVVAVLSTFSRLLMLPLEALWLLAVWPLKAADGLFNRLGEFVYGRPKRRPHHRSESAQARARAARKKEEAYSGRQH